MSANLNNLCSCNYFECQGQSLENVNEMKRNQGTKDRILWQKEESQKGEAEWLGSSLTGVKS